MKITISEDDGTVIDIIEVIDQECPYDGTEDENGIYLDDEDLIIRDIRVSLRNKLETL